MIHQIFLTYYLIVVGIVVAFSFAKSAGVDISDKSYAALGIVFWSAFIAAIGHLIYLIWS